MMWGHRNRRGVGHGRVAGFARAFALALVSCSALSSDQIYIPRPRSPSVVPASGNDEASFVGNVVSEWR